MGQCQSVLCSKACTGWHGQESWQGQWGLLGEERRNRGQPEFILREHMTSALLRCWKDLCKMVHLSEVWYGVYRAPGDCKQKGQKWIGQAARCWVGHWESEWRRGWEDRRAWRKPCTLWERNAACVSVLPTEGHSMKQYKWNAGSEILPVWLSLLRPWITVQACSLLACLRTRSHSCVTA